MRSAELTALQASPIHRTALILMRNHNTQSCCKITMPGEAANEAIMVSGKSHLSPQAPANRAGSAAGAARPETELTLIAEVQEADMKDARTHQAN